MVHINNKEKSLWWDLAFEWLLVDDPELAKQLMREGRLVGYLDECEGKASAALDQCACGNVPEDALAEHLLRVLVPDTYRPPGSMRDFTCCRADSDEDFSALIVEVLRASQAGLLHAR